ncbi:MAG: DUF805 domain-containing protein [Oscillospiraceae bacterium]|jgi:uncharacterized membrane protein YhaH (DUF805 family)|nr:DUF805 domain-containing protein [Oscillospiraceae bacterium]
MQEYIAFWKNYVNFQDRTNVKGFWMAVLFNCLASVALSLLIVLTTGSDGSPLSWLGGAYSLAVLIPGLAITVRRLRDSGKRWTYLFMGLIPIAGPILLIVAYCAPSYPPDGIPTV